MYFEWAWVAKLLIQVKCSGKKTGWPSCFFWWSWLNMVVLMVELVEPGTKPAWQHPKHDMCQSPEWFSRWMSFIRSKMYLYPTFWAQIERSCHWTSSSRWKIISMPIQAKLPASFILMSWYIEFRFLQERLNKVIWNLGFTEQACGYIKSSVSFSHWKKENSTLCNPVIKKNV